VLVEMEVLETQDHLETLELLGLQVVVVEAVMVDRLEIFSIPLIREDLEEVQVDKEELLVDMNSQATVELEEVQVVGLVGLVGAQGRSVKLVVEEVAEAEVPEQVGQELQET
jgi:hypothetical protein